MTAPDRKGPAPDKLYADRGPRGGWMFRAERMPDTLHSYTRDDPARPAALAEALAVVLDALKDGEVWGRAVNGASAVLNSGMPEEYWTRPKEIREALDAALRAIGEGKP